MRLTDVTKASVGLNSGDAEADLFGKIIEKQHQYQICESITNTDGSYILTDILVNGYTDKAEIDVQMDCINELGSNPIPSVFGAASNNGNDTIGFHAGNCSYHTNYFILISCGVPVDNSSMVMIAPDGYSGNFWQGTVEQGGIDNNGSNTPTNSRVRSAGYTEIDPGTELLYSTVNWPKYLNGSVVPYVYYYQYDSSKNYIGYSYVSEQCGSASVDPQAKYVRLQYGANALGSFTPNDVGAGFALSYSPLGLPDVNKRGVITIQGGQPTFRATGGTGTTYTPNDLYISNTVLTPIDYEITCPVAVFGINNNGLVKTGLYRKMTVYGIKLYRSNILTHKLVPAKRLSDGKMGMLDVKTNKFYEMTVSSS